MTHVSSPRGPRNPRRLGKTVLRDLGKLLLIPALMSLLTLLVCCFFQEWNALVPFLLTAVASTAAGLLLIGLGDSREQSHRIQALIVVALGWAILPLFGALPFYLIANNIAEVAVANQQPVIPTIEVFQQPLNALFEAYSGFTSAGLTLAIAPSQLPHALQWWRSLMQWVGGVGVIVLMLTIVEPEVDAEQLYNIEGPGSQLGDSLKNTVRRVWWIYLTYTGFAIALLALLGLPLWEAINHGMTTIATGGFSITDNSAAAYGAPVQLALMLIMTLGAMSFATHHLLLHRRRLTAFFHDLQHRWLWILLVGGAALLMLENQIVFADWLPLKSAFQWVSALTTCGLASDQLQFWSPLGKLIMVVAMICGGASGSTTAGIKLSRVSTIGLGIYWRFKSLLNDSGETITYRVGEDEISQKEAFERLQSAAMIFCLWIGAIAFGVAVLIHQVSNEYSLTDVIFESASALGGVGLSVGIVGATATAVTKLTIILLMWMGRLEIVPVLLLLWLPFATAKAARRQTAQFSTVKQHSATPLEPIEKAQRIRETAKR